MIKTITPKIDDINRDWFIIDAKDKILGRLATKIAIMLRGKHKAIYTPHLDTGDHVIVINANKIRVTGNKENQKIYYKYSGYPGGMKETSLATMREKKAARIIELAVKGMLPKNKLGAKMLSKLKAYDGEEHPHHAQQPKSIEF